MLGLLRLGKIVRFIPYPVVGGFLAGTGWLLVRGSLSALTGGTLSFHAIGALFTAAVLIKWIPGLCFGLLITLVVRRYHHPLLVPGLLALGVVVFYAILGASGLSVEEAGSRGFLVGPFPGGDLWPVVRRADLALIEWDLLRESAGTMIALTVLAGISILLNASRLEIATELEIDLDRELRATGFANLIAGTAGVTVGYLSLGESTLNDKVGARTRAPGILAALLCLLALVAGQSLLAYFPRPVLGAILSFLGFSILLDAI